VLEWLALLLLVREISISVLGSETEYLDMILIAFSLPIRIFWDSTSRARHSASGWSLASHRGGPGSNQGLVKWDL
jgi:hypothetical protein